jgi:hypothetical protein
LAFYEGILLANAECFANALSKQQSQDIELEKSYENIDELLREEAATSTLLLQLEA